MNGLAAVAAESPGMPDGRPSHDSDSESAAVTGVQLVRAAAAGRSGPARGGRPLSDRVSTNGETPGNGAAPLPKMSTLPPVATMC